MIKVCRSHIILNTLPARAKVLGSDADLLVDYGRLKDRPGTEKVRLHIFKVLTE